MRVVTETFEYDANGRVLKRVLTEDENAPAVEIAAPKAEAPPALPDLPGEPVIVTGKGRKKKAAEPAVPVKEELVKAVTEAADEISLEDDDAEDDFLKEVGAADVVVKPLELKDVRAELVKLQTAPKGNARMALGILKAVGGTEVLSKLPQEKFQAVVDATRAHPDYPK